MESTEEISVVQDESNSGEKLGEAPSTSEESFEEVSPEEV